MPTGRRERTIVGTTLFVLATLLAARLFVSGDTTGGDAFGSGYAAGQAARPYVLGALVVAAVALAAWGIAAIVRRVR